MFSSKFLVAKGSFDRPFEPGLDPFLHPHLPDLLPCCRLHVEMDPRTVRAFGTAAAVDHKLAQPAKSNAGLMWMWDAGEVGVRVCVGCGVWGFVGCG